MPAMVELKLTALNDRRVIGQTGLAAFEHGRTQRSQQRLGREHRFAIDLITRDHSDCLPDLDLAIAAKASSQLAATSLPSLRT